MWCRYTTPADERYVVDITDNQGLRAELLFPGNPATTTPLQTFVNGTLHGISTSSAPASLVGSSPDNSTRVTVNAAAGHVYFIAYDSGTYAPDSQLWLSWYE